jgi:hypothetical protein
MPETIATLADERPPTPAHERPPTLQSMLGLSNTELEILMRLLIRDSLSREQICGIPVSGHRTIKLSSVNGITSSLRRKLADHGIGLLTVRDLGFQLSQKDRARIVALIGPRGSGSANTEAAGTKNLLAGSMRSAAA